MSDGGAMDGRRPLVELSAVLREDDSVIAEHLTEPDEDAVFGPLAASGPRAAAAPGEYAVLVEAVREGYLLHYGDPRLVRGADQELRLLAGDYLYALGLERLAGLGDLDAVRELSDLIAITAQLHAERDGEGADEVWLASSVAVGAGASPEHTQAKLALKAGSAEAARELLDAARRSAAAAQLGSEFAPIAEAIESAAATRSERNLG